MDRLTNIAVRYAESWASLAWHAAWQGAVVGLLALAVVALGRRWSAPVRYWILVLALVKFATPSLASLPTGVFSLVSVSDSDVETEDSGGVVSATLLNEHLDVRPSDGAAFAPAAESGAVQSANPTNRFVDQTKGSSTLAAAKISSANAPMRVLPLLPAVLVLVHLGGTVLVLALFAIRATRLLTSWRRMEQPSQELAATFREIARQLGLRRVPSLLISRDDQIPYSMGILRPVVVLPSRNIEQLSPVELHAVLCHELAHHRRGDLWMNLLQLAISAAWWFHPVVWFVNRAIRSVREECCDDLLLSRKFVTDVDYCTTLVHVADACGRRRPSSIVVAVSMVEGSHPLTGRIRRIMDESLPRRERPGAWAVAALFALAAMVLPGVRAMPAQAPKPDDKAAATGTPAAPPRDPQPDPAGVGKSARPMRIRVVDADDRPVAGVKVSLWIGKNESNQQTGSDGATVLELPRTIVDSLLIRVDAEPFVVATAGWRPDREPADLPPDEFLFRLALGRMGGGRIVDEQNQPVAGAVVTLRIAVENPRKDRVRPILTNFETTTAADGTWSIARLPAEPRFIGMQVGHPDFVNVPQFPLDGEATKGLFESKYERILQKGAPVFGRVADRDGEPIAGATVAFGQLQNEFGFPLTSKTGDDGTYRIAHCPVEDNLLTVFKIGLAPHMQMVAVGNTDGEFNVELQPGRSLRIRVTDNAGQPIANATVSPYRRPETESLTKMHTFGKTDADGIWTWDWAPDQGFPYLLSKEGYVGIKDLSLRPGAQVHEVQLQPELRVTGKVVDDATGRPIPAFRATLGLVIPNGSPPGQWPEQWLETQVVESPDGEYVVRDGYHQWAKNQYVVRIEAEGYHSAKSRSYRADEENGTIDFRLVAAGQREAVALNTDGTPAAGASVLVGTASKPAAIRDNRPDPSGREVAARTDENGRFRVDVQADDFTVFVLGTSGFARVRRVEFDGAADEPVKIVLKPWARVEGTLCNRQTLVREGMIQLDFAERWWNSPRSGLHARYNLQTNSDANGRFVFDRVPAEADVVVTHYAAARTPYGPFIASGKSAWFKMAAGGVRTIMLGGTGRTVIGRFGLKDETWAADWEASFGSLGFTAEPAEVDVLYWPSPRFDIQRDGSFRIEDVPPGLYRLAFSLLALKPESSLRLGPRALPSEAKGRQGLMVGNITVPDGAKGDADQPVDVGTLLVGDVNAPAK